MPAYVAQAEGFFKKQGLDTSFNAFQGGGSAAIPAMVSGSVNVALTGVPDNVVDMAKGVLHAKFIMELQDHVEDIVARKGITSIQQLKGKKIGISAPGSQSDLFMRVTLNHYGIENQVTFVTAGPTSARVAALKAGKVDAIDLTSTARGIGEKAGNVLLKTENDPVGFPADVVMANDSYISSNPGVLRRVIAAINEGTAWLQNPAHFQQAVKVCMKYTTSSDALCTEGINVDLSAARSPYTWSKTGKLNIVGLENGIKAAAGAYPAAAKLTVTDIANTQFVPNG